MKIPDDYIDVAERIRLFKEQYPDGTLQGDYKGIETVDGKSFVVYRAFAYRDPSDSQPGVGWAWEPVPGPTPFTKDSELMNAETSAWGRAIVALGMPTKKIASQEEVRNRQAEDTPPEPGISPAQQDRLTALREELEKRSPVEEGEAPWGDQIKDYAKSRFGEQGLTQTQAGDLIVEIENWVNMIDVPFGDVPADGATV